MGEKNKRPFFPRPARRPEASTLHMGATGAGRACASWSPWAFLNLGPEPDVRPAANARTVPERFAQRTVSVRATLWALRFVENAWPVCKCCKGGTIGYSELVTAEARCVYVALYAFHFVAVCVFLCVLPLLCNGALSALCTEVCLYSDLILRAHSYSHAFTGRAVHRVAHGYSCGFFW